MHKIAPLFQNVQETMIWSCLQGIMGDAWAKGLAAACASALILECLNRGLYPSWDAANRESLALAEKLGYRFDREYPAYDVQL